MFDFCALALNTGKNWNTDTDYSGADTERFGAGSGFAEDTDPDLEKSSLPFPVSAPNRPAVFGLSGV